ncbi:AMP-binding protein [Virgibacillus dokdonensis]|uniref:Long-chain-fatty-acid--CoA ligase n=1 Tax=Virgibacillus dokdonensis TaxID=302167 RepID=A0A2K9J458_9BACI|nr:AMP-binding protein [Virgibacillus dokdonensis]AUJ26494.1 Long-chain-fatty-acid--CoA ligase [Virgibacillus dokdonensis]
MTLLHETVGELLEKQVKYFPNHEAIIYPELNLRKTYEEFNKEVNEAAKGLMALGISKGDHVAIWSDNKPEWLTTQFSTAKIGAVLVTVNTNYQANELEYLLKQSEASTLIMAENYKGTSYLEVLRNICPELDNATPGNIKSKVLPKLKNIIVLSETDYAFAYKWIDIMHAGKGIAEQDLTERKASLAMHDVINMQYTSGTTGFPKGVMLTHYNIVNNGKQIADCMKLTESDRLCIPVPFFHCFGCVLGVLAAFSKGATMVLVEQFDPEKVLKTVSQERCTALHGVPTMFIAELNHPNFERYDLSSLRTGIMSGSPCPMEVMTKVMERMGADEITIAYGQTEASPVITQTKTDDAIELRVSTVGMPHPNVEIKIVIPGTNKEQKRGVPGELLTRGYHVMKGYYNNPEATKQAIDEEGWLHTGDLALLREDGYLEITGRMKDMIIRGGENIYPREIEEFLYQHSDILDVQIVGVPDEKYGEEIMAWIIPKKESTISEADIRTFCEGNISWHKIPKYIAFVDEYPMTASGKIQKYRLKEMAMQKLVE